jgi:hypothetical protein
MTNLNKYAGAYTLDQILIADRIDISLLVKEFNIFTSIMDTTMVMRIIIADSRNFLTDYKMQGGDDIKVQVSFSGGERNIYKLKLAKIRDISTLDTTRTYVLECISPFAFDSQYKRIQKNYSGIVSDIAFKIWEEYGGGEPFGIFHGADNVQSVNIPLWTPLKTMEWLAKRAKYADANTRFRFYQDSGGKYNFVPMELFNTLHGKKPPYEYTYLGDVSRTTMGGGNELPNTKKDMFNVIQMYHADNMDITNALRQGVLGGTNYNIDVTNKQMNMVQYNYFEEDEKKYLNSKKYYDAGDYLPGRVRFNVDMTSPDNALLDKSQIKQTQYIPHAGMLTLVVNGNASLDLGDIIKLKVPKVGPGVSDQEDDVYSGKYMIMGKRDKFDAERMVSSIDVVKDGLK